MPRMYSNQDPHRGRVGVVGPSAIEGAELKDAENRGRKRKQRENKEAIPDCPSITIRSASLYDPGGNGAHDKDQRVQRTVSQTRRQVPRRPVRRARSQVEI